MNTFFALSRHLLKLIEWWNTFTIVPVDRPRYW